MKHVQENLFQFKEDKFFRIFEGEEPEVKEIAQEQEEVGTSVVEKAKENFSRFEKDAKGVVMRYKEFWEENEAMKANFGEDAKTYKMFDSTYVIGLMDLPDEALEPEVLDQGLETATDQEASTDGENEPEEEKKVNEAFSEPEEEEEKPTEELGFEEPEATATDTPTLPSADPLKKTIPVEEHPIEDAEEEVLDTPGQLKKCVVVYNMNGENREEIFRSSSNSVMHAFEDFYENGFKGAMKAIITKAREKQESIKKELEVKAKDQEIQAKKSKVDQFLKEK